MSGLFDTARVRDDPEHWDALAERIAVNAARRKNGNGFDWLAQSRASWVAASLLLVAALAVIALPSGDSSGTRATADWEQALAPVDDVGAAIALDDAPPAIGALLLGGGG